MRTVNRDEENAMHSSLITWFTKATATYKWGAIELDNAGYVLPANTRWYKTRAIAYSYARANFQKYAVARAEL